MPPSTRESGTDSATLRELTLYFLRLGAAGFGGPVVLIARMHRDLVEDRAIISERTYRDGVGLAQLAPGPLAAQLAMYLGWACAGARGAALVGFAFVAPSLLMVLVLSAAYVHFGGMTWISHVFYGVGAAVIAVIFKSILRLSRKTIGSDWLLWAIFAMNAIATAVTSSEIISLVVLSGALVFMRRAASARERPSMTLRAIAMAPLAPLALNATLFGFFAKASIVVFGSGLAVLPFLYGGVVTQHAWLTPQQFIDAVAVSMITPGPVVITVAFIGYLVAGLPGGLSAAAGMFIPTYAAVVLIAPLFARVREKKWIEWLVEGVTVAAIGAIAGSVFVLGQRALVDVGAIAIAVVALGLLLLKRAPPEPVIILAAAAAGLLMK